MQVRETVLSHLKLEILLRWSLFTFIYNRSTTMNYLIYTSQSSSDYVDFLFVLDTCKPGCVPTRFLCFLDRIELLKSGAPVKINTILPSYWLFGHLINGTMGLNKAFSNYNCQVSRSKSKLLDSLYQWERNNTSLGLYLLYMCGDISINVLALNNLIHKQNCCS